MATTITSGASSVAPQFLTGYAHSKEAGNLVHTIIGRSDPDVTLKPAGLRTGTLEMLFLTLDQAVAADVLHSQAAVLELEDTDHPALGMFYVSSGRIELELDDETRSLWLLRVDFQEVLP